MRKMYPIPGSRPSAAEPSERHPSGLGRIIGTVLLALAGLATGLLIYTFTILDQTLRTQIDVVDPAAYETISLDDIKLTESSEDAVPWDQGGRTRVYVHQNFPIKKVKQKDPDVENILVFGIDSRKTAQIVCRADALIVVSIDREQKSVKLTSISRDIQVPITGRSQPDLINTAYAYGGVGLLINTINENLGLDIQHFAMFDFWSAASLIDSLGGVTLNISDAELPYLNSNLQDQNLLVSAARQSTELETSGLQSLDGMQAIAWARIKVLDSDEIRTSRQRTVMTALFSKYSDVSISSLLTLINRGVSAFETNISTSEMIRIGLDSLPLVNRLQDYRVPKDGLYQTEEDPWMLIVNWGDQVADLHEFIWGEP